MKLIITFRSGVQVTTDIERIESRLPLSGGITSLEWIVPINWQSKLHYVNLADVVCLHVEDNDEQTSD